ncbi:MULTISPECIES: LPS-assembly protein LptD [unclassified Rhizobium]|uniref:LPS-assembly protein LptD n=1 Tax=unclassified Rhizobium TaxID=2613769 RepID=UPI001A9855B8|nr:MULTISPECIES: LPS-assembly protein LptD [unclassified Rhizobium]MBX5157372.1 LPS-assembly protein LptD [Rhizobium sp. NZLR8]MBX5163102.1 LPS-assembly protein LptD [Rhizobium sp. NZLR4b]MBX5168909.1 LPS-assembly protein LptD [Rhizobium sp. NZLR1b]MBX5183979.1 LPS-assembly protein LptD [Rhizobium sp. NZLR5]MBX5195211.1 LPS-assembly protein LptD [Rhizobium sp. NZLR10]
MAAGDRKYFSKQLVALLVGATLYSYFGSAPVSYGQVSAPDQTIGKKIPAEAKLLLSANELVYNRDADLVSAVGGVQINYAGYKMVAQKVEYNQKTGRMMAVGNVELVSPDGNRIYADNLDVTDNFADGFLNSLRIETADNTRIVAESGQRVGGTMMILNKGVYTACLPCAEDPKRAPFWQVKAKRVIQNGVTHTIRLERARFELLGHPIAFLPFIEVPDNTVKRKSGFLFPTMSLSQNLGFGLSVPYYYVISPSMDATVTGTGYTAQGFLIEGEFRQRFENGTHILRVAGIDQAKPDNFSSGTSDAEASQRGMVASKAEFRINPRWTFGWDVMMQSDNNFSKTYKLRDFTGTDRTNQIYLTGLGKRNYFDMRAFYFDVQDADRTNTAEKQQAIVYPSLDYHYVAPQPLAGGELSADVNLTNISRTHDDFYTVDGFDRFRGLKGQTSRLTTELQWKRTYVTPTGLVITPLLAARGDAFALNMDDPTGYAGNYSDGNSATRSMFTAGLEMRYPILMTTDNSTHILEPIAQIYARPDEQLAGRLPNEDAQSFVFDATSLFDRDKFSGYDRVEGGTRANLGVQYTGTFDSGYKLHGIFGQSYQIAGQNSFATDDLVNVGADSGLETTRSDYVGLGGIETPFGVSVTGSYRLDEKNFEFRRGDLTTAYQNDTFSTQMTFTHLSAQPEYGFASDNDELQTSSKIKFKDYWSIFGGIAWDLNNDVISRRTLGLSYDDECTIFTIAYTDSRDSGDETASDWTIGARLTFRTLGDIKIGSDTLE